MPRQVSRKPKEGYKDIAAERIQRLLELADKIFEKNRDLADRYVRLAWRIATKYNVRLPLGLRRKFCRKCLSFSRPGVSCRVRIQSGCVVTTCLRCGHVVRLPCKTKKQHKR